MMKIQLPVLSLIVALPFAANAQSQLPPDIHPLTLSRLPPVSLEEVDEETQRLVADRLDDAARPGPTHISMWSPSERSLGIPTGENSPVGARNFQLAVLITAREIDQEYEWSSHAPAGLRQGLEQEVIDVVKFDRPVAGLSDPDATFITFGRTLLRENQVSSALWEQMVGHFGYQQTVQLLQIMGAYLRVGIMLNAVDQQIPPDRDERLPPLER